MPCVVDRGSPKKNRENTGDIKDTKKVERETVMRVRVKNTKRDKGAGGFINHLFDMRRERERRIKINTEPSQSGLRNDWVVARRKIGIKWSAKKGPRRSMA
jgi:hypothetical protein